MTSIFLKVLELSLVGSYVILPVLAVRMLLRKSPRWCSYLLWSIVFLRLVLPVVPESDFSLVPAQITLPRSSAEVAGEADITTENVQNAQGETAGNVQTVQGENAGAAQSTQTGTADIIQNVQNVAADTAQNGAAIHFVPNDEVQDVQMAEKKNEADKGLDAGVALQILAYVWFAGVVLIGGYHFVSYHKFKSSLKGAVQVEPGVYEICGRHVSFVLGVFRPAIYLSDSLDANTRKVVLCHEQVHLKRKDYLTKPLALAVTCVHWFNPLVWLAFYLMGRDCEMSCDEKVVSMLGEESKKTYSYALLDEATKGERHTWKREKMCAVLSFGEDSIKARIKHVLNFKKAPVWLAGGAVVILLLMAVGLLSNRKDADYSAFIAIACSAEEYVKTEEGAFLTLNIREGEEEKNIVVQVIDEALQTQLVQTEMEDIIGASLILEIPQEVLAEHHIDKDTVNSFYFLEDSSYHQYLTLGEIFLNNLEDDTAQTESDVTEFQKTPSDALRHWAIAFCDRDGNTLYEMSHDKEAFESWDMVMVLEDGYAFGASSPWPIQFDFEIDYTEGTDEAVIRYWMRSSAPEIYPAEEKVKLIKDGDLYYIEHESLTSYHSIDTLEELKEAYVRDEDNINGNPERMSDMDCRWYDWTDNTGYDKDFMRSIFYHVANNTNPDYYDAYKDPVSAAKLMLHLGAGTGEVTEYLHRADSQKTQGAGTYGVLGEGTVVNVTYVFDEDGSTVQIPMVLAEESLGIWTLSAGDFTKEEKYTRGALPADANFLARNIIEEYDAGNGVTYQISDYGIYKINAEAFECIYAQDMSNILYQISYDKGNAFLYYPMDSQYQAGDLDTWMDSLCEVNLVTGEVQIVSFDEAAWIIGEDVWFAVDGGYIFLENTYNSKYDGIYILENAGKVWKGKTTAELTDEEKDAYGAANREYLLSHPGEMAALGNRYEGQTDAFIDMDGDGQTERIAIGFGEGKGTYWPYDSYTLKLDDWQEYRSASRLHNEIWAFSPDGERIYIALYEEGPSGDDKTTFFRHYNGKLVEAGSVGERIYNVQMEEGILYAPKRTDLIQTGYIMAKYTFDESGNLAEVLQETYDYVYYSDEGDIRLLKEMTLYAEPGGGANFTLQPQIVYFEQVDSSMKWIKLRANNGQTGWLEVTDVYEVYGSSADEWFEGLYIAD